MMNLNILCELVGMSMVVCGLFAFISHSKHLLNVLLSLEFIMLGIFYVLVLYISSVSNEFNYIFFFLSLAACEGALGLSLLVSVVRSHGNDCFKSFNSLGC